VINAGFLTLGVCNESFLTATARPSGKIDTAK
jgi:hypothetical protein